MKNRISLIVFIIIFVIISNEVFKQATKKPHSAKASRLQCQKKAVTFEKVLKPKLIKILQQTLKSGDFKIIVLADKAKYMKSVMFNFVDIKKVEDDFKSKIESYDTTIKKEKSGDIFVDMMIYENDKKDPGKKTARSKLYAGYIEVTFKVNKKNVYKIQTDFMSLKGADISQRISCIVKSVMSLGE